MPSVPQLRNLNLKVIFLVHFAFAALSSMGYWSSNAYLFYNSVFILLLIWSIYQDQNHEPIQLAIAVNGASIILDILLLIMCYPSNDLAGAREKFSAAMAILHLIVRPFSTFLLVKNLEERSGAQGVITDIFAGRRNESYEDLERNIPPATGATAAGYDFNTAQQI